MAASVSTAVVEDCIRLKLVGVVGKPEENFIGTVVAGIPCDVSVGLESILSDGSDAVDACEVLSGVGSFRFCCTNLPEISLTVVS